MTTDNNRTQTRAREIYVLATNNPEKQADMRAALEDALHGAEESRHGIQWEILKLSDFARPPHVEETCETYAGNATLKATSAVEWLIGLAKGSRYGRPNRPIPDQLMVVAEDSGLEVTALGGAPGIYSARFAGEHPDDGLNNQKLVDALAEVGVDVSAGRYVCSVVSMYCEPHREYRGIPREFSDRWPVLVCRKAEGSEGFGYDPYVRTLGGFPVAKLSQAARSRSSHRALALQEMVKALPVGGFTWRGL